MSKLLDSSTKEGCNFLMSVILFSIPFFYGVVQIFNTLFIELPYVLSDGNPMAVRYDSLTRFISAEPGVNVKKAVGHRVSDNKSAIISLFTICNRIKDIPCHEIERKIRQEGLVVNTFFYKKGNWSFVLPNDTPKEVRRAMWNIAFVYSWFTYPLLIILLIRWGMLRYRRRIPI